MIELQNITKNYGKFCAVDHVSLKVPKGSIMGLIGRNGAGKSTLMKMICGLAHEQEGSVRLFGKDPVSDPYVYRRIGSLIENNGFYPTMSAYDNMKLKGLALGCFHEDEVREIMTICGIDHTGKKQVRHFSLGMKQRLGIAMALMGNPELLILDEPTNGLDPQGILDVRNLLLKLNIEKQMTILISSHILGELSKLASSYAILKDGKLVEHLSQEELLVKCKDSICLRVEPNDKAVAYLEEEFQIKDYEVQPDGVIRIYERALDIPKLIAMLVKKSIQVYEVYEQKQDLETYFLERSGDDAE